LKPQRLLFLLPLVAILSACNAVVLHPSGDVAVQERDLIIYATELMLIVILPVAFLTALFAWHYRHTNEKARYEPDWHHSTALEVVVWGVPVIIIALLAMQTWASTITLNPYKQLSRIAPGQSVPEGTKPLVIEVVALNWKWLFIYPEQGIASVNEAAAPINQPVEFRITADRAQNALNIPALAGQIYAMPTMETELHVVANETGKFRGYSSRFSGPGFPKMHFDFYGKTKDEFDQWVSGAKASGQTLDTAAYVKMQSEDTDAYLKLHAQENPDPAAVHAAESVPDAVVKFGQVDPQLYKNALDQCVGKDAKQCLSEMRKYDRDKGNGLCRPPKLAAN